MEILCVSVSKPKPLNLCSLLPHNLLTIQKIINLPSWLIDFSSYATICVSCYHIVKSLFLFIIIILNLLWYLPKGAQIPPIKLSCTLIESLDHTIRGILIYIIFPSSLNYVSAFFLFYPRCFEVKPALSRMSRSKRIRD